MSSESQQLDITELIAAVKRHDAPRLLSIEAHLREYLLRNTPTLLVHAKIYICHAICEMMTLGQWPVADEAAIRLMDLHIQLHGWKRFFYFCNFLLERGYQENILAQEVLFQYFLKKMAAGLQEAQAQQVQAQQVQAQAQQQQVQAQQVQAQQVQAQQVQAQQVQAQQMQQAIIYAAPREKCPKFGWLAYHLAPMCFQVNKTYGGAMHVYMKKYRQLISVAKQQPLQQMSKKRKFDNESVYENENENVQNEKENEVYENEVYENEVYENEVFENENEVYENENENENENDDAVLLDDETNIYISDDAPLLRIQNENKTGWFNSWFNW